MPLSQNRGCRAVLVAGSLLVATSCLDPSNPYDLNAPSAEQARASLRGVLLLDDPVALPTIVEAELDAITVELAGEQAVVSVTCGSDASADVTMDCVYDRRQGSFEFRNLVAGRYRLSVEGVANRYVAPALPTVELSPGGEEDVGTLRYVVLQVDPTDPQDRWTGRVTGVAELVDGTGEARQITLLRQTGSGLEVLSTQQTDQSGAFAFTQLPPGVYALSAEAVAHTPDYRAGFSIELGVPEEENTVDFSVADRLQLQPIAAVLIPALQQTFGSYYTRADSAPIQVLQFGGMNRMRLSTDPTFAGGEQEWLDYAASTTVDLGGVEGPVTVHAQFMNNQVEGFSFVSSVFSVRVIRDVTPPEVLSVTVRGRSPGEDGRIWLSSAAAVLTLDVDARDDSSAVYEIALYHDDSNGAGDPEALSYTLTESPAGLVRLRDEIGLSSGEGEKRVYVYLRDLAGNTSAAGSAAVWVDTTAPVIEALVLSEGASYTAQATVAVALQATDLNQVTRMQVWAGGQSEPSPQPYQNALSVRLAPLDYGTTLREVHAVVFDQAGNASSQATSSITFDDRGQLTGGLYVEDAADGSPGDTSGLLALVDGQSMAIQSEAGAEPGDPFRFVISGIKAGPNKQLVLKKEGYGDTSPGSLYSVVAGASTDVGVLSLRRARGAIEGYVILEGEVDHSGIVATLAGSQQLALTDSGGYFVLDDVTEGPGYTLVVRRDDNWTVATITGIDVPADGVYAVSTSAAPIVLTPLGGSVSILEGAYTRERTVTLELAYDEATEYRASESADFLGGSVEFAAFSNAVGQYPFELADQDGSHRIHVQFRDPSPQGFLSEVRSDTIILDRAAPTEVTLRVNGGAAYANSLTVNLELGGVDDNGIASYQLAHRDTDDPDLLLETDFSSPRALAPGPFGVVLPGTIDPRTVRVWARLIDVAGNVSAPVKASFILDPAAPTGLSIAINDGAEVTRDFTVTLALAATDDSPLEMLLGNGSVPPGGTFEAFAASKVWILPPATQGTKRVCVAFRDAAGNVSQELCDSIEYDSIAPPLPDLEVLGGLYTRVRPIELGFGNITSDVERIEVASNAAMSGAVNVAAQAQVGFTLGEPDGTKVIYARYLDAAGNASPIAAVDVVLDRQAPAPVSFAIDAEGTTFATQVDLLLSAPGASEMRISRNATCALEAGPDAGVADGGGEGGDWQAYATRLPHDLLMQDGEQFVSVVFRDLAGNETGCLSDSVVLDRQPPQLGAQAILLSDLQIVLNAAGDGVESASVRIDLDVTGAVQMKVSNRQGTPDATWQPFAAIVPSWRLTANDGQKTVYALFKDAAGNVTDEVSAGIFLDTRGEVTGTITLEGSTDYTGLTFVLGHSTVAHSMAGNAFTLSNVLVDFYTPLRVQKSGYDDGLYPGVQIVPGEAVNVGAISLKRSRGTVEGYVRLVGEDSHQGALIELRNTGHTTQSNSAGYFILQDVLASASDYTLVARKDGFATAETTVQVQSGLTTSVGTLQLSILEGDFTINGGAPYTRARGVLLDLEFTGAVRYRASESESFEGDTVAWLDYDGGNDAGGYPFALGDSDGLHTVYVQFQDGTGTTSDTLQATITLDRTPPTVGTVLIEDGDAYTRVLNVSVAVSSSDQNGVNRMQLSTDGTTFAEPVSFQSPLTRSLTGADGERCLYVRFLDPAGNASDDPVGTDAAQDCITLDRQPPIPGAPALQIENAVGTVLSGGVSNTASVYLRVAATDATEMMLSNKANFAGAVWQPYDDSVVIFWTLVAGDGDRTVFVAYRDQAGNPVGTDGTLNATVAVDTQAPPAPIFTIHEGAYTASRAITLDFTNPTDGDQVLFASNMAMGVVQEAAAGNSLGFSLPDADGLHFLSLRYRDPAGNESAESRSSITLDRSAPTLLSFSVAGNGYTALGAVTLLIEAEGAARMRFSNTGDIDDGVWENYRTSRIDWPIDTGSPGAKAVLAQVQDQAGNPSSVLSAEVTYDAEPPSGTLTLAGGVNPVKDRTIVATISNASADVAEMSPADTAITCADASYIAFASSFTHVLANADANNDVYVCLKDHAGRTARISASVRHDGTPPQLTVTVPRNTTDPDGAVLVQVDVAGETAGDVDVNLQSPSATPSAFTVNGAGGWTGSGTILLLPAAGSYPDGEVILEIEAVDTAGNVATAVKLLTVDRHAPNVVAVRCTSCTSRSNTLYSKSLTGQVALEVLAADNLGEVSAVLVSVDGGAHASSAYTGTLTVNLPVDEETAHTIDVDFVDPAGNHSNITQPTQLSITLDHSPPSITSFALNSGATYTQSAVVAAGIVASDGQTSLAGYRLGNGGLPETLSPMPGVGETVSWLLASPEIDGEKIVTLQVEDAAGNTAQTQASITLDDAAPVFTAALTLAGNNPGDQAGYSADATVDLAFTVQDALVDEDTLTYCLANDPTFAVETCAAVPADGSVARAWTLGSGDGLHTVHLRVMDPAGNQRQTSASILVDASAPEGISVSILENASDSLPSNGFTSFADVTLNTSAVGATERCVTGPYSGAPADCTEASAGWEALTATKALTITGAAGVKVFAVYVRDAAHNVLGPANASVTFDTAGPAPVTLTALGEGPTGYSRAAAITLQIAASDSPSGLMDMMVSESDTFSGAEWEEVSTVRGWTLSNPDGGKTVYLRVRDRAGLTTDRSVAITLDRVAPSFSVALAIAGDGGEVAGWSYDESVTASFTVADNVDDAADLDYWLANDPSFAGATANDAPANGQVSAAWSLLGGEGQRTLYVKVVDQAGNSAVRSASIGVDGRAPESVSVWIEENAADQRPANGFTQYATVTLHMGATGATERCVLGPYSGVPANCDVGSAGWLDYTDTAVLTLTGSDGSKTLQVYLRDDARNTTGPHSASVVLDTTPPAPPILLIDGAGPAGFTSSATVTLQIGASDAQSGVDEIMVSESATFTGASYEALTTTRAFTLSNPDEGKTVYLRARDRAGLTRDTSSTITLDRAAPTLTAALDIAGDSGEVAGYSHDASVDLDFSVADAIDDADQLRYWLGNDPSFAGAIETAVPASGVVSTTWALQGGNGARSVYLKVEDRTHNQLVTSASIVVDGEPPEGGDVWIEESPLDLHPGNGLTNQAGVTLHTAAVGATERCVTGPYAGAPANCAAASSGWEALTATKNITLNGGDGDKVLNTSFRDAAHNPSSVYSASVRLDTAGPTTCTVALTGTTYNLSGNAVDNTSLTALTAVEARVTAADDNVVTPILDVQLSNDGGFGGASWRDYTSDPLDIDAWLLAAGAADDVARPVYVRCRDAADNVFVGTPDSINLDNVPPSSPSVLVAGGAEYTTAATDVALSLTATGAAYARWGTNPAAFGAWQGSWEPASVSFASGDGMKTAYAEFRDAAGNRSAVANDSIFLDTGAPCEGATPSIAIDGGATFTSDRNVTVTVSCSGEQPALMRVNCNGYAGSSDPTVPYQPTFTCLLASGDGTKRVDVQLLDTAGNVRNVADRTIELDQTPPAAPTLTPNNVVRANAACARIQPSDTVDSNFSHWEMRSNGTEWEDATGSIISGKINYSLLQDTDNFLEVRAVDLAGNKGASSTAYVNEVSSVLVPTNLTLKQVCNNGEYAILRGTESFPPVFAAPFAGASASVLSLATTQIELLDLTTLALTPVHGEDGLANYVGGYWTGLHPSQPARTWGTVSDAGCSVDNAKLLIFFVDTNANGEPGDAYGHEYSFIIPDPIGNPITLTNPLYGPKGPWEQSTNTALGVASIDVIHWWATEGTYEALVVSTTIALSQQVRKISCATSSCPNVETYYQSYIGPGDLSQGVYGLALWTNRSIFLVNNHASSRWEIRRSTAYGSAGTVLHSIPYSAGFGTGASPWGTLVKQGYWNHYSNVDEETPRVAVYAENDGEVRFYDSYSGSSGLVASGGSGYTSFVQRGYRTLSWVNKSAPSSFTLSDTYGSSSRLTFRYEIDQSRPMFPTRMTGSEQPRMLYHNVQGSGPAGVVVGYNNASTCVGQ